MLNYDILYLPVVGIEPTTSRWFHLEALLNQTLISIVLCVILDNSEWIFATYKPNVSINSWDTTHYYYIRFFYLSSYCFFFSFEKQWKAVYQDEVEKSCMADHVWKEKAKHLPLWDEFKIIDMEEYWSIRPLKEAAPMLGYGNLLSKPSIAMNIIWELIIKKAQFRVRLVVSLRSWPGLHWLLRTVVIVGRWEQLELDRSHWEEESWFNPLCQGWARQVLFGKADFWLLIYTETVIQQ